MTPTTYLDAEALMRTGSRGDVVRQLQNSLRSIGYLKSGIDGEFGPATKLAVMSLQYDLLHNNGTGPDGDAPVRVVDYNKDRIRAVTGEVDQLLAACIADIMKDPKFPKLPYAKNAHAENKNVAAHIASLSSQPVPIPFLLAILEQETGIQHYHEPSSDDEDSFIMVGLDRNSRPPDAEYAITSRGYGVGQYTLFHHPPAPREFEELMLDPARNISHIVSILRNKFDHFICGRTRTDQASDRIAEFGDAPLRLCKYPPGDPRCFSECCTCARLAGVQQIILALTPFYTGATGTYEATPYYRAAPVTSVPARVDFGCDWPYAVRRYNGSGVNSYWYQSLVLNHLMNL